MKTIIKCPICEWTHQIKPIDPRISQDTLAGVFGTGIMLQQAINSQARDTEEALEKHLSTHKLVEWVQKVSSLEHELTVLKSTFP